MAIYSIDYANKLVKRLKDLHNQMILKERSSYSYRYFSNEEPEIPEYNFAITQKKFMEVYDIIISIKHKIREINMTHTIQSGITADEAILELAFLNRQKDKLQDMARAVQKTTISTGGGANGSEIRVCNYDVKEANAEYNRVYNRILQLQDELNSFNALHQVKIEEDVEKLFEDIVA